MWDQLRLIPAGGLVDYWLCKSFILYFNFVRTQSLQFVRIDCVLEFNLRLVLQNIVHLECGPGYGSPTDAMKAPREKLLYVQCVYTGAEAKKPDYLATVDCDPTSELYGKVFVLKYHMTYINIEYN